MAQETLHFRDAIPEWDHVPSRIVAEGRDTTPPFVTIAITTFKRSDLLVESVQSALAQRFDRPFEVIILDNDPASTMADRLVDRVPALRDRSFRYFVNGENFGVFGNFNRCITVARGQWLTILNDDDLLDDDFLRLMFEEIDAHATTDGIVCLKRYFGGTFDPLDAQPSPETQKMSGAVFASMLRSPGKLAGRVAGRVVAEINFRGRRSRRIPAGKFFWGAILGNGGGFLFRRSKAIEVGGFYPEEYPSADYWFFARFAKLGHLRQHRAISARIRLTDGSISVDSLTEQLKSGYRLQHLLAGSEAPRWLRRLLPMMISHYRVQFEAERLAPVPKADLEAALNIRLPPHRPRLYALSRLFLGGL